MNDSLELDHQQTRLVSFAHVAQQSLALSASQRFDVRGCYGCSTALVIGHQLEKAKERLIVALVANTSAAQRLLRDLLALVPEVPVRYLPPPGESPYEQVRPEREASLSRVAALCDLHAEPRALKVLIVCAGAWVKKVPRATHIQSKMAPLRTGAPLSVQSLILTLDAAGYQRVPLVEDRGSFALRGELLDVWPPSSPLPLRLELEFEQLKTITPFDPESQRKRQAEAVSSCVLGPAKEAACTDRPVEQSAQILRALCDEIELPSTKTRALIDDVLSGRMFIGETAYLPALCELVPLADHLPPDTLLVVEDPSAVVGEAHQLVSGLDQMYQLRKRDEPAFAPAFHALSELELDQSIQQLVAVLLHRTAIFGGTSQGFRSLAVAPAACVDLATLDQTPLISKLHGERQPTGDLSPLVEALRAWLDDGHSVTLTTRTKTQSERLATLLSHRGLSSTTGPLDALRPPRHKQLSVSVAPLAQGIFAPNEGLVLVTEEEIFGRRKHIVTKQKKSRVFDALDDLRHLSVGDLVVHVEHGIGRYQGLLHQTVGDVTVDVLAIEYFGGDRLLLPVYRLNQVQKLASEGSFKLDRLGGQTFAKTKSKVRKKVRDIADQLLRIYSARHQKTRPPLPAPGDDYLTFEASFPYEETPDQAAAIVDVLSDLQKDTVMDRLVCGDVGFGKTEVALRATFLSAHHGRQVALLCPTTVLADQHLGTFRRRLDGTGIEVNGLSRFESKSAIDKTLAGLKIGSVDVVVGTHRLLSKDVFFKNLGLLIIDEEQRFGVSHKERLKELRAQVDVLTLSATPIPRTLNLAVGGLFDMSVILTPPQQRRSIRTQIARFDEQLVAQAIARELARGGQVFYVHNRVEGLIERAALLQKLLPDLKVGIAHGQMSERELENTMHGFVQGSFDVLCATAIIESGLDIPRANTIIIDRADLFGLAQLYQLRGRVGRSKERAYCYLLIPSEEQLNPDARKRIEVLERYSDLGSGFQIASMDMEIRGAGDVLGAEQTGFTSQIGLELFAEMLTQATSELRGEEYVPDVDPELSLDVEAYLPESYIDDVGVRLSLYKRYASAPDAERIFKLDEEVSDRFGAAPKAAVTFSSVMLMKTHLRTLKALGLQATAKTVHLHLRSDTPLPAERLVKLVAARNGRYSLSPDGRLTRRASDAERFESGLHHAQKLLEDLERFDAPAASQPSGKTGSPGR